MRVNSGILIGGVAGVLIGGFAASMSVYIWVDTEETADSPRQTSPVTVAMLEHSPTVTTNARKVRSNELEPYLNIESVRESLALYSDFDQSVSLYLLLARAAKGDIQQYINESILISSSKQRNAALSIIFGRYATLDPLEAVDRALTLDQLTEQERSRLIQAIFNEWTTRDIDAAVFAIDNLPDPHKYSAASALLRRSDFLPADQRIQIVQDIGLSDDWIARAVSSIRGEAAKADPRSAFYDRVRESTYNQPSMSELLTVARHWIRLEGAEVLTEIHDSLDDRNMRRGLLHSLIWSEILTGNAAPIDVMRAVSEFSDRQDAKESMENLFETWSRNDPKQSFEHSFEFGDQFINREFRKRLLRIWAGRDAVGLLTEASFLPRDYQDVAVVFALGRMSRASPEEAIQIARSLAKPELKRHARDEIVKQWSYDNAKDALDWLINDGFNIDDQNDTSIFTQTLSTYLNQDFAAAEKFVRDYQGELNNQFVEAVASHLVNVDVERAIDYLPNVNKDHRISLQVDIGTQLVEVDPLKALSFGKTVERSNRHTYFDKVLNAWADSNFFALHEDILRVPSEYRMYAAEAILDANESERALSDREIQRLKSMGTREEVLISTSQ